ncbi:thioredoxin-like protein [Nannochloropsis gaditana]|uniref:Sulfhydryl oxidase n=2 Tax=Nannochloropsis gaditana TaxID=72520 RepID=W7T3Q1_9STRA|nr:thioredoxin-like protein [Nannochloropsis gaditana]
MPPGPRPHVNLPLSLTSLVITGMMWKPWERTRRDSCAMSVRRILGRDMREITRIRKTRLHTSCTACLLPPLIFLLSLLLPTSYAYEQYLFSKASDSSRPELKSVEDLSRTAFESLKANGEPWAIMFYSPTCGHCQHFAPTWAAVWGALRGKKELGGLQIGAVSCLAEAGACQDERVHAYPTLKAYGVRGSNGKGTAIPNNNDEDLISWITSKFTEQVAGEDEGEVLMGNEAREPARSAPRETSVSQDQPGPDSSRAAPAASNIAATPKKEGPQSPNTRTRSQAPGDLEAEDSLSIPALRRARVEDAFTSLRFALDHDLFLGSKVLRGQALSSLRDLLHVLSLLFPGGPRRRLFRGLLEAVYPLKEIGIAEWEDLLARHLDPVLPSLHAASRAGGEGGEGGERASKRSYEWAVCGREAGYTCGLWTLFHLLSVKSAVRARDKAASSSTSVVSPLNVLLVIEGFVSNFFGCQECRDHFLNAFEETRGRWADRGPKGAVWWVYDLHDKVNVRLGKRRWPPVRKCPRCWGKEGASGEPEWEALYEEMVKGYDVHDTETAGEDRAMGGQVRSIGELAALSRDYAFVSGIMLVLCFAFCVRLRKKLRTGRRKKWDTMLPM